MPEHEELTIVDRKDGADEAVPKDSAEFDSAAAEAQTVPDAAPRGFVVQTAERPPARSVGIAARGTVR